MKETETEYRNRKDSGMECERGIGILIEIIVINDTS